MSISNHSPAGSAQIDGKVAEPLSPNRPDSAAEDSHPGLTTKPGYTTARSARPAMPVADNPGPTEGAAFPPPVPSAHDSPTTETAAPAVKKSNKKARASQGPREKPGHKSTRKSGIHAIEIRDIPTASILSTTTTRTNSRKRSLNSFGPR